MKTFSFLQRALIMVCLLLVSTVYAQQNFLVDDFEDGDSVNNFYQDVYTISTDQENGGNSTASYYLAEGYNSQYAVHVDYTIDRGAYDFDPYVQIYSPIYNKDLSASSGVSFWYKGPQVFLRAETLNITDYDFYRVEVPASAEWTEYTFTWAEFSQQGWGNVADFDLSVFLGLSWQCFGVTGDAGVF
ncbi:MAG: hypothetical protein ACOCWB_06030, partial [Bacteroidota bacterium]